MKILVAMSGGVDSSVAAKLLTDAGHTCIGCTMKLYQNEDTRPHLLQSRRCAGCPQRRLAAGDAALYVQFLR